MSNPTDTAERRCPHCGGPEHPRVITGYLDPANGGFSNIQVDDDEPWNALEERLRARLGLRQPLRQRQLRWWEARLQGLRGAAR